MIYEKSDEMCAWLVTNWGGGGGGPQNTTFSVHPVSSLLVLAWTTLDQRHDQCSDCSGLVSHSWSRLGLSPIFDEYFTISSAPTALDREEVEIMILYSSAHGLLRSNS